MSAPKTVVIIGAGHAGGRAAEAMRAEGYAGHIVLLGEEGYVPYERPPLSKELLAGEMETEKTFLNPPDFYDDKDIDLRLEAHAEAIDREAGKVRLKGGKEIGYDRLLIATGGRVRKLPCEGAGLRGVYYIRTLRDSLTLRPELKEGARVAVVGGGFIGLEVAATARKRGCEVTVVELADEVLARVADSSVGAIVGDIHREEGVRVITGASVERLEGESDVAEVICTDGETIEVDLVVVGIGIAPNVEIARDAGLDCGGEGTPGGIRVDEYGRSSDPDIFAAGDVAFHYNPVLGHHVRLESWENAQKGGIAVARNMVIGEPEPYAEVPWFWSDQYDLNLQIAGAPERWDRVLVRGDPAKRKGLVFYMDGPRVVGATAFNLGREMRFCKRLIESGREIPDADLADENKRLRDLVK